MFSAFDSTRPDLGGNIQHSDANTFTPLLWRYIVERFAIRSMLDVGCGEGHAVHFFWKLGVFAHGIDGLQANIERAVIPIARHDLLESAYIMPVDLVWSSEVAEHIAPDKVDNYLDTLANGKIVAMTHALPGQDGHHHVNCQPPEYWVGHMARRGYEPERSGTLYREIAGREPVPTFFGASGLLFVRK